MQPIEPRAALPASIKGKVNDFVTNLDQLRKDCFKHVAQRSPFRRYAGITVNGRTQAAPSLN